MRLLLVILFSLTLNAGAQSAADAYTGGDYAKATELWESELEQNGPNASLLFNLGNAYYRLGEYGPAIYSYEKALISDPRSPDIRANLELARKAATAFDETRETRPWLGFLYWLSFNEWVILGTIALFALAAISLLRAFGITDRIPVSLRGVVISSSLILVVCIAVVLVRMPELNRAIVINENTEIKLSPFPTADTRATLRSGQSVQIEEQHGDFYRISNGWVSRDSVKPLMHWQ